MRVSFVVASLLIAAANAAAFEQPIATTKLDLQFRGEPAVGRSLKLSAAGITVLPASGGAFPASTGGSLIVDMGPAGAVSCDLAAGLYDGRRGWRGVGTPSGSRGYKYINRTAPTDDACRSLIVKNGLLKLRAVATGSLSAPLAYPPGNPDIEVSVTLGDVTYCGLARAPHARERAGRSIRAAEQPAPPACASVTTTTQIGTTSTTTDQAPPCGVGSKCVFVTAQIWDGSLGGLTGADRKCQLAADSGAAWLRGRTFRAWLSDRTTSAASRISHAAVPYRLVDGTEIASGWADLVDGSLSHAIDRTELGAIVSLPDFVWTGTNEDGSIFTAIPPSYLCDDWTYIFWDALVGDATATDGTWTAFSRSPQDQTCDASYHLYCIEQ